LHAIDHDFHELHFLVAHAKTCVHMLVCCIKEATTLVSLRPEKG
jgi:hypothetical protein